MVEKIITCIICPVGCEITVRGEGDVISFMEGHTCKRGEEYASSEFIHPMRILTSTVKVEGAATPLVPVRSSAPIPLDKQLACMEEIRKVCAEPPVHRYDVLVANILETGADIVATGQVE